MQNVFSYQKIHQAPSRSILAQTCTHRGNNFCDFCQHRLVLLILEFNLMELYSLSSFFCSEKMILRFIHMIEYICTLFLFITEEYSLYICNHNLFIYSSVEDISPSMLSVFFTLIKNTAIDIHAKLFLCSYIFSFLLGKYLAVELLVHRRYLTLREASDIFLYFLFLGAL